MHFLEVSWQGGTLKTTSGGGVHLNGRYRLTTNGIVLKVIEPFCGQPINYLL
jgi:hypothetical protein